ncbi:unnamed protein product [Polarella glacialis]|uniref:Uncharacterized protein n=1 Tax=Polarella glacialis TaxID=89957 RepID=A0A813J3X0_POLGL|nr:unnamed protein product [Polarella glacialis]CAE8734596.1 unnamed protein product [Polarella glacialis]
MVFMQDDWKWKGFEECFRPDLDFQSLEPYYVQRRSSYWRNAATEQCARDIAGVFNLTSFFPPKKEPVYGMHPFGAFAVGRKNVLKHPLSRYKEAYANILKPRCHDGPLELDKISDAALKRKGYGSDEQGIPIDNIVGSRQYATGGLMFEYMEHMIFGHKPLKMKPMWKRNRHGRWTTSRNPCDLFVSKRDCPGSLCFS